MRMVDQTRIGRQKLYVLFGVVTYRDLVGRKFSGVFQDGNTFAGEITKATESVMWYRDSNGQGGKYVWYGSVDVFQISPA